MTGTEFENGAAAFFEFQAGIELAIWNRKDLAQEPKVPLSSQSSTEFTIGHNVGSKDEVEQVMVLAFKAGAVITDPANAPFWGGYSSHFLGLGRFYFSALISSLSQMSKSWYAFPTISPSCPNR
ncbi:hypothetical protein [Brevibacillus choshinensis]|uniref:hypothetical protein n=1 Tax=Brevibacillus choshinensis TaxID=54911 RepID=UPI002E1B1CAC|nr:hypothetical protein [Brevibacillus choshinensis]